MLVGSSLGGGCLDFAKRRAPIPPNQSFQAFSFLGIPISVLTLNESYNDCIRWSVVSLWLEEAITAVYTRPRSELSVFSLRPREIRA